jgi:hypothetical protein
MLVQLLLTCRHRNAAQNPNIRMANKFFENVEPKYLEQTLKNLNRSHEEMKTLNRGKVCYISFQNILFSYLVSKNIRVEITIEI